MRRLLFIFALCLCSSLALFAETNYKVSSASRLNVRKSPSTSGAVLGTLKSGQEITVLSIQNGWAKVEFNKGFGYVSAKYITELPKKVVEQPEEVEDIEEVVEEVIEEVPVTIVKKKPVEKISTPLVLGSSLSDKISLYFAVQGGVGYSNFIWGDGDVSGNLSYSADIVGQLYFEDKVSFIPKDWYSELALGYDKRGAANFGMNYIHARVYPFGYRFAIEPFDVPLNVVVKGGLCLAFPMSDLETSSNSWSTDFQCGVGGGFQIEWKQFAIGCNVEYDFTEVSSSCNQTLNNIAVLGTLSYKFGQLGHKK